MKSESLRSGPRHWWWFQGPGGDANVQPGLSSRTTGVSVAAAWLSAVDEVGTARSSGTDCHVHLKYGNDSNQG